MRAEIVFEQVREPISIWIARGSRYRQVELLDRTEGHVALMDDQPEHAVQLHDDIDTLRMAVAVEMASDPESVIELGQQVLMTVPCGPYYVRAVAWLWLAVAYQMVRKLEIALGVGENIRYGEAAFDVKRLAVLPVVDGGQRGQGNQRRRGGRQNRSSAEPRVSGHSCAVWSRFRARSCLLSLVKVHTLAVARLCATLITVIDDSLLAVVPIVRT